MSDLFSKQHKSCPKCGTLMPYWSRFEVCGSCLNSKDVLNKTVTVKPVENKSDVQNSNTKKKTSGKKDKVKTGKENLPVFKTTLVDYITHVYDIPIWKTYFSITVPVIGKNGFDEIRKEISDYYKNLYNKNPEQFVLNLKHISGKRIGCGFWRETGKTVYEPLNEYIKHFKV